MKFKIIKGLGNGRKIGFPTINFDPPRDLNLKQGVYACFVKLGQKQYMGAFYYGPKYNFGILRLCMEVHLIGIKSFPRARTIELNIVKRVRGVRKFVSIEALVKQIKRDIDKVKKILKNAELD